MKLGVSILWLLFWQRRSLPGRVSSQSEVVVDGNGQFLLSAEIALGRLDRSVAEQKLNLRQVPAILAAKFCAGAAQVVCAEVFDSDLLR
jgi:hypothetical protein